MAVDMATLAIKITQDGVKEAQVGLEALAASGAKAEKGLKNLGVQTDANKSKIQGLQGSTSQAASGVAALAAAANNAGSSISGMGGAAASSSGAVLAMAASGNVLQAVIYAAIAAMASFIGLCVKGIPDQEKFKEGTESMAAAMVRMASDQSDFGAKWNQALEFTKGIYDDLTEAGIRHRVESQKIVDTWVAMANQGIVVKRSESDALATIVSAYSEMNKGQVRVGTVAKDIQNLMDGHVKSSSELARFLESIGLDWQKIGEEMKKTQSIQPLSSALEAQRVTDQAREGSLKVQGELILSTTSEILRQSGMYESVLGVVRDINSFLREHKDDLIAGMISGWNALSIAATAFWDIVKGIYHFIKDIYSIVSTAITWAITISVKVVGVPIWLAGFLAGKGEGVGAGLGGELINFGKDVPSTPAAPAFSGIATGPPEATVTSEESPFGLRRGGGRPGGGGGGKGAKDTSDQLERLVLQLQEELTKAANDGFGAVEAWYNKLLPQIRKLAMTEEQYNEAVGVANLVKAEKNKKVADDFNKWYLGQMGMTTALEKLELDRRAKGMEGHAEQLRKIEEVGIEQRRKDREKFDSDVMTRQKSYMDSLAGITDNFEQQIALKQVSLALEQRLADVALNAFILQQKKDKLMTESQEAELRGLHALEAQAKKYQLARKSEEERGTLTGWAIGRTREAEERSRTSVKSFMVGAEKTVTDMFDKGITAALTGDKKSFKEVGKQVVQSMILEMNKHSWTKIWDNIAKMLAPRKEGIPGVAGAGARAEGGAESTGGLLNQAAVGLQQASVGFNLNTAQFGLAAGGLLLSGIGVMTGSQALIYAGTFLQLVAMAIQIIQMLTATTTAIELTGAAVALTGAAGALIMAAAIMSATSSIPFFQHGGIMPYTGPAMLHAGERVLTPSERHKFEARTVSSGSTNLSISIDARGAQKGMDWKSITKKQIAPEIQRLIKNNRITT